MGLHHDGVHTAIQQEYICGLYNQERANVKRAINSLSVASFQAGENISEISFTPGRQYIC